MTEEQYAEYVMAMKDETPVKGYREISSGRHDTPHLDAEGHKRKGVKIPRREEKAQLKRETAAALFPRSFHGKHKLRRERNYL